MSKMILVSNLPSTDRSMNRLQLLHADRSPFFGSLKMKPFFQFCCTASVFQIFTNSGCNYSNMSVDVWILLSGLVVVCHLVPLPFLT